MSDASRAPADLGWLEASARADLRSFAGRARALEPAGVLRWRSGSGLLVTTVRARGGAGLLGRGTVLGMRAVSAPSAPERDAVVSLAALLEALYSTSDALPPSVPPTERAASWVGLAPPRRGWEPWGEIPLPGSDNEPRAPLGEVTAVVSWLDEQTARDAAGALAALGFLTPDARAVRVFRVGPWTRLSTPMGHVLAR